MSRTIQILSALQKAAEELDHIQHIRGATPPNDGGVTLAHEAEAYEQVINHLRALKSEVERQLAEVVPIGDHVVGGLLVLHTQAVKRSQWDHDSISRKIIQTAADRGELTGPLDAARLFVEMAGISYWKGDRRKHTGTYRLGIDRDDFCNVSEPVHTVRVKGPGR